MVVTHDWYMMCVYLYEQRSCTCVCVSVREACVPHTSTFCPQRQQHFLFALLVDHDTMPRSKIETGAGSQLYHRVARSAVSGEHQCARLGLHTVHLCPLIECFLLPTDPMEMHLSRTSRRQVSWLTVPLTLPSWTL